MPRKFQSPRLEVRKDSRRPYFFVRVTVTRITEQGLRRMREQKVLGFCDEISAKEARKRRAEALEPLNSGKLVVQSQLRFRDVAKRFLDVRVVQLGAATQSQYASQINNHLTTAFGEQRPCDIDRAAVEQFLTAKAESLGWWARNNLRGILSAIFRAAKDWKLWDGENPALGKRCRRS